MIVLTLITERYDYELLKEFLQANGHSDDTMSKFYRQLDASEWKSEVPDETEPHGDTKKLYQKAVASESIDWESLRMRLLVVGNFVQPHPYTRRTFHGWVGGPTYSLLPVRTESKSKCHITPCFQR
jgi:hypothetical protein